MITLTKIRLAGGEETPRFEACLCWHGRPAALVSNEGTGGACRVFWTPGKPQTAEAVMREACRIAKRDDDRGYYAKLDPEQPGPLHLVGLWSDALDYVIMRELDLAGHAKALDRACKTYTVFRLRGAKPGQFWKTKGATPADLRGKPDVAVVLNDLPSRKRAERLTRHEEA